MNIKVNARKNSMKQTTLL